ncbi:MAG: bifunctional phosphoribosyl-AMP cyclohydrolase/phosphoribosyl-ATP diphosphatase HisIE [Clostridiales bacterium]|nr:bifunctional phosphoribosyl-AMP cyclohydrolase/phosphoribosyl-ATP diphosphatase HisIE [Clostridiales bacterium]
MELNEIRYDEKGLVPVIAQDFLSKQVLMLAYANAEAMQFTLETGIAHYYSRSRQKLWKKGETSGHYQHVVRASFDCDGDAVLLEVLQDGNACHTGEYSCFFNLLKEFDRDTAGLEELLQEMKVIQDRKQSPQEGSYTNFLFAKGIDKIAKKVGEEAVEVVIAAKNADKDEICYETADLIYHLFVLLAQNDMTIYDICGELKKRR